jgi:hypothetical protein
MNHEYDNYFSWVCRTNDVITKIEDLNHGLKIDYSNYRQVFNNLDQYLKIDDVILNTEVHPFLKQAIKGAIELPDHEFKIIFSDLLKKTDLKNHDLCDLENGCKLGKIREKIFNGLAKFFEKADRDLDAALTESIPNYNHNLHFVNYENILDLVINKFTQFNSEKENFSELLDDFKYRIQEYKNLQHKSHDMAFKLDLNKLISVFDSDKDVIVHDFDQEKHFNLNISEEYKNFPKFSLFKVDFKNGKPYVPLISAWTINYLPKSMEKLYLMFFDHTLDNLNNKFEKINGFIYMNQLIYSEVSLEILFEYITSKNFKTNNEIKNFFNQIDYHDLYNEFDEFYKNHIKKKSINEYTFDFNHSHFENIPIEKMHLIDQKTNEPIHHFWFGQNTIDNKKSGTWIKPLKMSEKMSNKRDIFEQIKNEYRFS